MECAAALASNGLRVTMAFPEDRLMGRLLTPELAAFYEDYFAGEGGGVGEGLGVLERLAAGRVLPVVVRFRTCVFSAGPGRQRERGGLEASSRLSLWPAPSHPTPLLTHLPLT